MNRMMRVPCDFCGAEDCALLYTTRDFIIGSGDLFHVVRCRRCGHVYVNPRPTHAELTRYYPDALWTASGHGGQHTRLDAILIGGVPWRTVMARRAAFLHKHVSKGRMLEIGCGNGLFLVYMRDQGWEVEGVEPGASAADYARKCLSLVIHEKVAEQLGFDGVYDVVTLHQSLQCVDQPSKVIGETWKALKVGGYVLITVPNFASFDRWVFGRGWVGLQAPSNLHHFTPRTLRNYLTRAGFKIVDRIFVSNEMLWPAYYSDSLRRCLSFYGLYRPSVMAPRTVTGAGHTSSGILTSPNHATRLLHHMEYVFFRAVGAVMDRLSLGSSFAVIARKT